MNVGEILCLFKDIAIIELENNTSFLLLLNSKIDNDNYFLAVRLENDETPTQEYIVLKEVIKNNEIFTQKVKDPIILNKLLAEFQLSI